MRVPSPKRPLALLFIVYHFMAPLCYLFYRLRGGAKFDLVQALESNLSFGDLLYSHFCHRMYLSIIGASPAPKVCEVGSAGSTISFTPGWKALPIREQSR